MKSCAIIAEYNPFHNGHAYQLKIAREQSQADIMIVLMSGNFVQRGEPALLAKEIRTKLALKNGADLVIELPWFGAIQAADYFGSVAVELLQAMHIDTLCFGTEKQQSFDYMQFVKEEQAASLDISKLLAEVTATYPNWSYPKRLNVVYQRLFGQTIDLNKPNHVLGLSYARANLQGNCPLELLPIVRIGANHHEGIKEDFASGTAIREAVLMGKLEDIKQVVPVNTYQALATSEFHTWDDYYPLLKAQILTKSLSDLKEIYQMTEGLEYKIKQVTKTSQSFSEWLAKLKSSRYTIARLQRLATYLLLNIKVSDIDQIWQKPSLKVLGFNNLGRKFLKQQEIKYPVITAIRKQDEVVLNYEQRIDEIYHLVEKEKFFFAKEYQPIIIKDE